MPKVIWVLVNCNTEAEAERVGKAMLRKRLASCFDILNRKGTWYFWPPKSGKIEHGEGAVLVLETFRSRYRAAHAMVRKLHSDRLPFIGYFEIKGTSPAYQQWMREELR